MTNSERRNWPAGHGVLVKAAGLAWDLVQQIAALRRTHGLSQSELAEKIGTKQPNVSRLENPTYDRQNLQTLRAVGDALDAYVDVIYVPRSEFETYIANRYLPALGEKPPMRWFVDVRSVVQSTAKGTVQAASVLQQSPWAHFASRTWHLLHTPQEMGAAQPS